MTIKWSDRITAQGIKENPDGSIEPFRPFVPGSLLVMSDIHRGAFISALPEYEASLKSQMASFEHVVLNGDIFEMFYVDPTFYGLGKKTPPYEVVKEAICESIRFLEEFLEENPNTKLHFVLGNHEVIQKFRTKLDDLQKKHKNFEWSPEAIKIGDALFVHGDLPLTSHLEQITSQWLNNEITTWKACKLLTARFLRHEKPAAHHTDLDRHGYGITDEERETLRLREAKDEMRWTGIVVAMDGPGQSLIDHIRKPEKCIPMLDKWLMVRNGTKDPNGMPELQMSENRIHKPFKMDGIGNVFFGHTHVDFNYLPSTVFPGVHYHNTGALTKTVMEGSFVHHVLGKIPPGHGMLQADIRGGIVENIRLFDLENNRGEMAAR